jgi:hypothetical protein
VRDANIRADMEDVIVAACHCMALAHIHLGSAQTAQSLSKTATEHIRASRTFSNPNCNEFSAVFKAHQITMSMRQLTNIRSNVAALTTKAQRNTSEWRPAGRDKTDPNLFVPGALERNLPGGLRFMRTLGSTSMQHYDYEGVIADVFGVDGTGDGRPRYPWSGKFDQYEQRTVTAQASTDPFASLQPSLEELPADLLTVDDLSRTLPKSPLGPFRARKPRVVSAKSVRKSKDTQRSDAHEADLQIKNTHRSVSADPIDIFRTDTNSLPRPRSRLADQDRSRSPLSRMYFVQAVGAGGKTRVLDPLKSVSGPCSSDVSRARASVDATQVCFSARACVFIIVCISSV